MGTTRIFHVKWDNRKLRHRGHFDTGECEGVHFSNGMVALSNGMRYDSVFDMNDHFKRFGNMSMTYQDQETVISVGW